MKYAAALLLFGLTALAQDNTRVLEGSVVNRVTGSGIDGAKVVLLGNGKGAVADIFNREVPVAKLTLQRSSKGGLIQSVTDETGNFQISGILPGDYQVIVQKPGFFNPLPVYPNLPGTSLHVDAATDPPRMRLELFPPAILRGRVFGTDGKPAVKVQVALGPVETTTITDDDGAFVFEDLQPGQYNLAAMHEHVRTYFPATIDPAFAESISVRPGEDQGGYEVRLQAAGVYRVRGVVLDAAGKPSAKSVVSLVPDLASVHQPQFVMPLAGSTTIFSLNYSEGVPPAREPNVVSGQDGAFEFPSVREGDWMLRAESQDVNRGAALVGVWKDIDDVRIRLESPVEILGDVVLSDGSPAPANTSVYVMLISTDGMRDTASTVSNKSGSLRIENVSPGRSRVAAIALSAGYYVASVMVGEVDAMRQPVFLGDSSPRIRIVLNDGGRLSGNVDKGEGAKLLLVPQTLAPGEIAWVFPCGAGGNFEYAGIPPGDYYAIAVTRFDLPSRPGIEGLRAIMRDATAVRVEEGAMASVQLKPPR